MSDRGWRVLGIAVAAYSLIGVVVAGVALGWNERDFADPQMLLMGAYFTLLWPIVLVLFISEWFGK